MVATKKIRTFAQRLLIHSLDANNLISIERIQAILQTLRRQKPTNHLAVLRAYKLYVSQKIKETTALVEYACCPTDHQIKVIQVLLSQKYGRNIQVKTKETSNLLAGIKISVADDVYEASIHARLKLLAKTV